MSDSDKRIKPEKPTPDFPLFPHASGRWAKKIQGATHYFGPWADPEGALENYERQKDQLHKPKPTTDAEGAPKANGRPKWRGKSGQKPEKPNADFPLFPHANGRWAKKIDGKLKYFGPWDAPDAALAAYQAFQTGKSTKTGKKGKVNGRKKPYVPKGFPLWPHPEGQWAKQINGKFYYFGVWEDRDAALESYLREKDDLKAGRVPKEREEKKGFTVGEMVNRWLDFHEKRIGKGLQQRTFDDYERCAKYVIDTFGTERLVADIATPEFATLRGEIDKRSDSPRIVRKEITWVRSIFKWADEEGWLDRPVRFGASMKPPSDKEIRRYRSKQPKRMFTPEELRAVLKAANPRMRAMTLLGINAAFWNIDCARLTLPILGDFKDDWLDFDREKNGAKRACPLWPETIKALKAYLAERPEPASEEYKDLVFLTFAGRPWMKGTNTPITQEFAKVLKKAEVAKPGLNFGALRHTFQTIAENATRDQVSVAFIMGHTQSDIATNYREEIWDKRIRACTEAVHKWLHSKGEAEAARRTF